MPAATWGMRVSPEEREALERLAELERSTMKAAVLTAVRRRLAELGRSAGDGGSALTATPGSYLERAQAAGVVGFIEGPGDLSTNKAYLEDFGEDAGERTSSRGT